jgi:hypothetical protein
MTGYSWKPGGWEDQTDMQPVELPEFRDACGHHHLYHEECAEKLRKVPERAPIWVTLYLVDRAYGGPEEGGWWYDTGEVIATWPVPERDLAEDIILMAKHAGYTNEGRRDIGSVLSDGIYEFTVDWEPGQDYPQRTPHYE